MPEEDGVLVKRSLDGDVEAFETLIRLHKTRVCRTLYLLLSNPDDVEDVAQEVFIRVYRHLSTYRGESGFSTWLHRITINTLRNWTRTHRPTLSLDSLDYHVPACSEDIVEARMLSLERASEVRKALSELPEHYREALVLRHFDELSYEEIAQVQQVPLGTVRSRIAKGRQLLFDKLSPGQPSGVPERTLIK